MPNRSRALGACLAGSTALHPRLNSKNKMPSQTEMSRRRPLRPANGNLSLLLALYPLHHPRHTPPLTIHHQAPAPETGGVMVQAEKPAARGVLHTTTQSLPRASTSRRPLRKVSTDHTREACTIARHGRWVRSAADWPWATGLCPLTASTRRIPLHHRSRQPRPRTR